MKIKTLLTISLLFITTILISAPFKNIKKTLTQPDGTILHCFASGDEFYNRLHDIDGYTIVQAENGYFVYATTDKDGKIIPTQHIAGKSNPKTLGIKPNIVISQKEYFNKREKMAMHVNRANNLNHGVYNNLIVYIKFKGDEDLKTTPAEMDSMFNNNGYYDISMNNYFKKMTYNQLSMVSYDFPQPQDGKIVAYEDIYPRNHYTPYNATTNPDGYKEEERGTREFALLARAIEHIADDVPDTLDIDRNNDGLVDNVIFVVKGNTAGWSDLLWPHCWSLHGEDVYIHNKRVMSFNFQLETSQYFSVSTLCHEMAHSLGLPDFYHYKEEYENISPVGEWDLMSNNANPPQHTATYIKQKYGTWIDEIPEIGYGTYTLEANSWEGGRRNCYRIPSSDPNQYYIVEYRNNKNFFEVGLPDGGLLIYRVDPRFNGCTDFNAKDVLDELYIYRPGGSLKGNGQLISAAFSKETNRTVFNHTTNPSPFLNFSGIDKEINICNISEKGDQMSFSYLPINSDIIPNNLRLNINSNKCVELKWDTVSKADSYNIYRDDILLASNINENHYKDEYQNLTKGYHNYYVTSNCQNIESFHSNEEYAIIGDYCEYIFDMNCSGDNGWQGGEITLSFNNGMEDIYLTMYSGKSQTRNIIVPKDIEMSVYWTSGWDDTECSFSISNNGNKIYESGVLQDGLLTNINTQGKRTCVQPKELTAESSDCYVELNWYSFVENDSYILFRNDEIIADDITTNHYIDNDIKSSGSYVYYVKSKKSDCVSEASNSVNVSVLKYNQNIINAEASLEDKQITLDWEIFTDNDNIVNYDDGEYVTSVGSNSTSWGIKIPTEKLKIFKDAKITGIEIFDACSAKYSFNIFNGEIPDNVTLIHSETFNTNNSGDFKTFALSQKIDFSIDKDLWITAKSTGASNKPIPCGKFTGDPNSNMVKMSGSWKSASEYDMNNSWLLRVIFNISDDMTDSISYNIYRQGKLLASNINSTTYIDNNIIEGKVCYNIEAIYNGMAILYSDDICMITGAEKESSIEAFPNPTNDIVNIKSNDIRHIKIMSVTGSIIFEESVNCNKLTIDMKEYDSGVYLIQVTTETETSIQKVVVF